MAAVVAAENRTANQTAVAENERVSQKDLADGEPLSLT